uniref:Uncharacterized protein n=1 Tax=Strigamia maritima TaxID=126957 RepID=T1IIS0_STRMM
MVFFTCNACGQSIKKNQVEKHTTQCRRCETVSCIDCLKDFHGDEYKGHTKCITEEEKYSGQGFKPKPSAGKAEKKQEEWLEYVRKAIENSKGDSKLLELLNLIIAHDNIPRKQKKFENFANNCGARNPQLVEKAWKAIKDVAMAAQLNPLIKDKIGKEIGESNGDAESSEKTKSNGDAESKQIAEKTKQVAEKSKKKNKKSKQETEVDESVKVGEAIREVDEKKSKNKKRKLEPEIDNKSNDATKEANGTEDTELKSNEKQPKNKKRKVLADGNNKTNEINGGDDKQNGIRTTIAETRDGPIFKWRKVAKSILLESPEKSMSLKKLKKKVFGEYKMLCQSETCDRHEIYNKIQDELFKQKFQLENDIVKLVV